MGERHCEMAHGTANDRANALAKVVLGSPSTIHLPRGARKRQISCARSSTMTWVAALDGDRVCRGGREGHVCHWCHVLEGIVLGLRQEC
eukprot:3051588-Ditylum_brightwellii.AAC.1